MRLTIKGKSLNGSPVEAIPSKSAAHRVLIASALAGVRPDEVLTGNRALSDDVSATKRCLENLFFKDDADVIDCGESGSTLRFLLPVAAAKGKCVKFVGCGRLPERPLDDLVRLLAEHGVKCSSKSLPLSVSGRLEAGEYSLPGDVSSQYVTGLLFALPLLDGDSVITLTTPLQSSSYVGMTLKTLRDFGIVFDDEKPCTWKIKGRQKFVKKNFAVIEGDWSNAAFFLAAGAIRNSSCVSGLDENSLQGDRAILSILEKSGAEITVKDGVVSVRNVGRLRAFDADVSEIPDLLPVLSVVASVAEGTSRLYNASRVRLKECDRLACTSELLASLGAEVEESPSALVITGGKLHGGCVKTCNDHRLVMASAVAAVAAGEDVTIDDEAPVKKSYPSFFQDWSKAGGEIL